MSMEPFDYLTYKKNKLKPEPKKKDRAVVYWICLITFAIFFVLVMVLIGSKSSKIDIEYGRFGENTQQTENEDEPKEEKFTIDKRLFLIQQEEHGPSESRTVEQKEQAEVISKSEFQLIKTNRDEIEEQEETSRAPVQNEPVKAAIKPKIDVQPKISQMGALTVPAIPAKVLIGKYQTLEDARQTQTSISNLPDGTAPFVRRVNGYYSVQIGAFENYETAKSVASKLKIQGYDAWILQ